MRISKMLKCKMCGGKTEAQIGYMSWSNVECFESFLGLVWIKNWWLCRACKPVKEGASRYHDIDGHNYMFTTKWPFLTR